MDVRWIALFERARTLAITPADILPINPVRIAEGRHPVVERVLNEPVYR